MRLQISDGLELMPPTSPRTSTLHRVDFYRNKDGELARRSQSLKGVDGLMRTCREKMVQIRIASFGIYHTSTEMVFDS
jgi:hypothetical protein